MTKLTKTLVPALAVCALILVSPALAQTPEAVPGAPLEASPAPESCEDELLTPAGQGSVVYTAGGCSAWASCWNGSTVSCSSGSSSGTCTFRDSACSPDPVRGFVRCDGVTTWCPLHTCPNIPDCSALNTPGCSYSWNMVAQCCWYMSAIGATCLDHCFQR